MLFNALSVLGLATLAVAAPQFNSRYERDLAARDPVLAAERGLIWVPRSVGSRKNDNNNNDNSNNRNNNNNNNNNNVITITQLEETQLTVIEKGKEIQLTELVEKKLVIIDQTRQNKDNIRKNHYRNKNSNLNTVIIVVTQIIDIRDPTRINTRYMTHQVQSNENAAEKQMVVVSDSQQMTIGGNVGTAVQQVASPTGTGTGSVSPDVATYDPNAAPSVSNSTEILPSGVPAPNFDNTQVDQDPAVIIQENQAAFVQFVQSS